MKVVATILVKCFVRQFYRENAGSFLFFITVMFLCVGPLDGSGLIEYHYSLMMGMLASPQFTFIVCVCWLLYARKCYVYMLKKMASPEFVFLHLLNASAYKQRFYLLLSIQTLLFAPVILYGLVITGVAYHHHYFLTAIVLIIWIFTLCMLTAVYCIHRLQYMEHRSLVNWRSIARLNQMISALSAFYPAVLLRFILGNQKWLILGIKIFTCGIVYGMAMNNTHANYEVSFTFLFFNFGVLANGIIIYKIRLFEETHLVFYRGMPVGLLHRFLEYSLICFLLLAPEFITVFILTPVRLDQQDAWNFALCALSITMLLTSISFLDDFSKKAYLRVVLVVMSVEYFFVIADALNVLYVVFFLLSAIIFFGSYYSFEKSKGQIGN